MYKLVAIAGTFDRLHKGHRYFIRQAFKLGRKVIVGLTSDEYVKKKLSVVSCQVSGERERGKDTWKVLQSDSFQMEGLVQLKIQEYRDRKKELEDFLTREKLLDRAEIVKINDVYGPAIENNQIEALVVTEETLAGGLAVNRRREELGLPPLKLLKLPMILAQDSKRIASTRIRIGEIDRWGRVLKYQISNIRYQIDERLRQELKKPLGLLIKGNPNDLKEAAEKLKKAVGKINPTLISTIGDEVTKLCNEVDIIINLAIIDYKVKRERKYNSLSELGFLFSKALKTPRMVTGRHASEGYTPGVAGWSISESHDSPGVKVTNPPGHITNELVNAVKEAYLGIIKDGKQRIIEVDGEEDLAGVPAVLLAPLGSLVLYGQPGEGVVVVEVTEERKETLLSILTYL